MNIAYIGGRIANVTDAMGNKVSFTYESDRLAAVMHLMTKRIEKAASRMNLETVRKWSMMNMDG